MSHDRHTVTPANAPRFLEWIRERGGVAVWSSIDLSDPGYIVSTPAVTDGVSTTKPSWKVANKPERIIDDAAEIDVVERREVKRFHVAVRLGSQGLTYKLTDASTRRVREAVKKAGEDAAYEFDYEAQEAVITVPETVVPLDKWARERSL